MVFPTNIMGRSALAKTYRIRKGVKTARKQVIPTSDKKILATTRSLGKGLAAQKKKLDYEITQSLVRKTKISYEYENLFQAFQLSGFRKCKAFPPPPPRPTILEQWKVAELSSICVYNTFENAWFPETISFRLLAVSPRC